LNISNHLNAYLTQHLYDLETVEESLPHHPEENALVHSLQTFELARNNTDNQPLIAAALLHDIGKVQSMDGHAALGAELLHGLLPNEVVWLVRHHMDLVYDAKHTERLLRNTQALNDLKLLRKWDLRGRVTNASVCSVEFAVASLCKNLGS